jgi:hypothetical protein
VELKEIVEKDVRKKRRYIKEGKGNTRNCKCWN